VTEAVETGPLTVRGAVVVVIDGTEFVVVGFVAVVVGGTVVVRDGTVVAVVEELDVPGEEADAAALTAAVPAINPAGDAIKMMETRIFSAPGGGRAGRRRAWCACRAVGIPIRLIAPWRNRSHAQYTCRSSHGPLA
jgi:hypothetical protein